MRAPSFRDLPPVHPRALAAKPGAPACRPRCGGGLSMADSMPLARASRVTVVLSIRILVIALCGAAFPDTSLEARKAFSGSGSGQRAGTGAAAGSSPAVPGTRFAFGTRFGRPAEVRPPEDGALATAAARQPSSAGEDQLSAFSSSGPEPATACRPRRNQSDSTDSKIGSRLFLAEGGAGRHDDASVHARAWRPAHGREAVARKGFFLGQHARGRRAQHRLRVVPNPSALAAKGPVLAAVESGAAESATAGSGSPSARPGPGRAPSPRAPGQQAAGQARNRPRRARTCWIRGRTCPLPARSPHAG